MIKWLLTFCVLFFSISLKAQSIEQLLTKARELGANEYVYLDLDKSSFIPGETLWFKGYAFAGNEQLTDKTILHVSIVAPGNQIVSEKKLLLKGGAAAGYFILPISDSISYYSIQAYTTGMITLDSANVYSRTIFLKNDCNQYSLTDKLETNFETFPEGGSLIEGISNTVAFRIQFAADNAIGVGGLVLDQNADTVLSFEPSIGGLGKFEMTAESGKQYKAVVTIDGEKIERRLPIAAPIDYSILNVYPVNKGFAIRVRSNQSGKFSFIAASDYAIRYKAVFQVEQNLGFAKYLPDSILSPGVNHFLLLDQSGKIVAQRLYYNINNTVSNADLTVDDSLNGAGQLLVHFNQLPKGNYSLSITNANKVPAMRGNDIRSLKMESSIVDWQAAFGQVPLFENDSIRKIYYDLLMLTQGSMRYEAKKILGFSNKSVVDDGEMIRTLGQLMDAEKNRLLPNEELTIFIKQADTLKAVIETVSDKMGLVRLPSMILEDTATVYFKQPKDNYPKYLLSIKPTNIATIVKPFPVKKVKDCENRITPLPAEITQVIEWNNENSRMMQGVTVTGIRKSPTQLVEEKYVSPWFSSLSNERGSFDFINDYPNLGMGNVIDFLRNRVMINGSGDVSSANMVLNESVVDKNIMMSVNLSDVAIIKVMGPNFIPPISPYIPGENTVIVYTKKGDDNTAGSMGVFKMKLPGFAANKPYFNSVFDNAIVGNSQRTTLYWNPAIQGGKFNGLFCKLLNPTATNIRVVLQGIDEKGQPVYIEKTQAIKH